MVPDPQDFLEDSVAVQRASETQVVFSYWKFDASGPDARGQRKQIVNELIVSIFADVRVRKDAACIYARKYTSEKPEDIQTPTLEPCDEVRLYVAAQVTDQAQMAELVAHYVPAGQRVSGPLEYHAKDRACLPDCDWYRRGLTEVAAVALDLHSSPLLETHRKHLRELYVEGGLRELACERFSDYLLQHAPHYARTAERQTLFWSDFLRWGPAPNLFPPGHLLANLILVV